MADGLPLCLFQGVQDAALLVDGQQGGVSCRALAALLCQQQVLLLEERVLDLALNLGSQTGFQVEMLSAGLC